MENVLAAAGVCLLVILCVLLRKYLLLKRNIRHFSNELEKLKDEDYRQPVKVTDFDKDIVELAVKVNEHTDIRQALSREYENSRKQLGTVISGISHDFRTPLTASLGYLQMIEKSGELSEKNREYLDIAMEKNRYLKALSDEFFELSKADNGREELVLEETNLSNILSQTLLEQYAWIEEKGISPDIDITDGIIIKTDKRCLTRILNNLMSNARKYTAYSFAVRLSREGESSILRVSNSLEDSSTLETEKVFEPFYRMAARTAGGSGLGLYVVRQLCERLGWSVRAELEKDVFTIEIRIS